MLNGMSHAIDGYFEVLDGSHFKQVSELFKIAIDQEITIFPPNLFFLC